MLISCGTGSRRTTTFARPSYSSADVVAQTSETGTSPRTMDAWLNSRTWVCDAVQ
ncbi:hypothetical protein [Streptomyces zhihengii]|uniref:hypothetical protein n=1 Tax=Streptomyces zhihengii TaxID=1818004 RepID=UPI0033AC405B